MTANSSNLVSYTTGVLTTPIIGVTGRSDSCGTRRSGKLPLLQLADWKDGKTYDEKPPTCIHYSIEWRVTVNGKVSVKETEQDVVLAPRSFWELFLRPKLDRLVGKRLQLTMGFQPQDTGITVSVTDRSERDLTKHFEELNIDWPVIEKQLQAWSELFRCGKKLRLDISFNYIETDHERTRSRKRPRIVSSSATSKMLAERALQLDAEHESQGQPSVWRDVYNLMRCTGTPCTLGPYCWRDPIGHKHYNLKTHHLRCLIRHAEQGNQLETHEDVPHDIRQQLYDESQQHSHRQRKRLATNSSSCPPINITNVLPAPASQTLENSTQPDSCTNDIVAEHKLRLQVPGLRDIAVKNYTAWQQSKVDDKALRMDFQKACDATLVDGLDLELVHMDQDPTFYIEKGIRRGVARRFVNDIESWVIQVNQDKRQGFDSA